MSGIDFTVGREQKTYDKCFQECDYCGGWLDEGHGPYPTERNAVMEFFHPSRGTRKICVRCLIDAFDNLLKLKRTEDKNAKGYR